MWTVREQMKLDALGCIAEVRAAGYQAVELVGYGNAGFDAVRDRLVEQGVRAISQHVNHRRLSEELDDVIAENVALGCSYLVVQQGRHEDWVDEQAVRSFAATCNEWGAICRDAGLRLGHHGYHEIDQEFAPLGSVTSLGPATRWDLFAAETDPDLLFLQLDTYWVRLTGNDPAQLLDRFAGRVPTMHLKDTAVAGEGDTVVGDGLMDLGGVLAAARQSGTSWVIVEQEGDPDNAFRDIRRSRLNATGALSRS
jgi:sugar phosphate isomerase/epimerase